MPKPLKHKIDKKTFECLYIKQNLSYKDMAKIYGCCEATILNIRKRLGIDAKEGIGKFTDLTGRTYNNWTVIKRGKHKKRTNGEYRNYWVCKCICGNIKELDSTNLKRLQTKTCTQCNKIGSYFWSRIQRSAKTRNLEIDIDKEYALQLFIEQNGICAISGIKLILTKRWYEDKGNASLDRIDSSKGYVKGNVQWVDKRVNTMKWNFDTNEFILLCRKIVDFNKDR